ncbi:MAG: prepilin-type N-terminal cleavage/methylation domain-containing protein [Verrucomicrobiota bacterium]
MTSHPPNQSRRRARRGFTLLELVVATALFAMAALALGQAVLFSIEAQNHMAETDLIRRAVTQTAEEIMASTEAPETREFAPGEAFPNVEIKQQVEDVTLTYQRDDGQAPTSQVSLLRVVLRGATTDPGNTANYQLTFYVRR